MPRFTNPYSGKSIIIPKNTKNLYNDWIYYNNCLKDGIIPSPECFFKDKKTRTPNGSELCYAAAFIYQLGTTGS